MVFAPLLIVVTGGLVLAVRDRNEQGLTRDPFPCLIIAAGFLYLGCAAMTGLHLVHAILRTGYSPKFLLTLLFLAGPVILGIFAVRAGLLSFGPGPGLKNGIAMVLTGIPGQVLWAGLFIGPLRALAGNAVLLARSVRMPGPA